jgi:hypothetical protein
MSRRLRRLLVVAGVAISLVAGLVSIRIAADLAIAAAPPPAPPVSMQALQAALQAEQARAAALQDQLDDLLGATDELSTAIDSTDVRLTADGQSAKDLRARLKAAQARLALLTKLLKVASARLTALGGVGPTVPPGGGSGGGGGSNPKATPRPTPRPTPAVSGFSLALSLSGSSVVADWTACSPSGFSGYALVRSTDSEIHYPPEDRDTLVTTVAPGGATVATDAAAPSGRVWYRTYCLRRQDNETQVAGATNTVSVAVP